MTVLIVAAMPLELRWIRRRSDVHWITVAGGLGPTLAARAADRIGPVADLVLSAGLCGSLVNWLPLGQIVVGSTINGVAVPEVKSLENFTSGPIASVDYIANAEEKRKLQETGAIAVEMEAAAVLERARSWKKPFYCVKAVSDTADEQFRLNLNAARNKDGHLMVRNLLRQALSRPGVGFPELLKLKRQSELAAKALGEFLANCRF